MTPQTTGRIQRLRFEYIERHSLEYAVIQTIEDVALVLKTAPARIDNDRAAERAVLCELKEELPAK